MIADSSKWRLVNFVPISRFDAAAGWIVDRDREAEIRPFFSRLKCELIFADKATVVECSTDLWLHFRSRKTTVLAQKLQRGSFAVNRTFRKFGWTHISCFLFDLRHVAFEISSGTALI